MKKLTTIFGALLFSCLIITSCGSDKNDKSNKSDKTTTTPKKTPLQVEAEEAGDKICEMMEIRQSMMSLEAEAMKMIENEEADSWDDPKILEMEEEYRELEDKFNELDEATETMILDKEFDNAETAEKYISYFKESVEKCRDAIEEFTGWDDMIGDIEYSILSQFDTPIEENNMELSSMESDAMEMSECYCMIMELGSKMNGEYDEETAMEFEAVSEYCEELANELEPIYSGNQEFMQLMEEFSKDCQ